MRTSVASCHELDAFLDYEARGGLITLVEWMRAKDFTAEDRAFIAAGYRAARAARVGASA